MSEAPVDSPLRSDSPARIRPAPQRRYNAEQQEAQGIVQDEIAVHIQDRFLNFLRSFQDEEGDYYYVTALEELQQSETTTLQINWAHLRPEQDIGQSAYEDIADVIQRDFYRFEPYLRRAVQNFVREYKPNYVHDADNPADEDKEFYISIVNYGEVDKLRDLRTDKIGQLTTFSGTVTRTTDVRPELLYGTFTCLECGTVAKYVPQQFKYTTPKTCTNSNCGNTRAWQLDEERSKFADYQKCRVQENSQHIPAGSMPRSIDVILRNEQVELCTPGNKCAFTGTLIVVPDVSSMYSKGVKQYRSQTQASVGDGVTGLRTTGVRELNYKLVFLANFVTADRQFGQTDFREDESADEILQSLTEDDRTTIMRMKDTPNLYSRLANSIAPNIFGHEEIKRGILLQLFGGVRKWTKDGVKLRGDINICVIGDPSTAKSQFLKFVTRVLPSKTIYTSGKASTAAGLTAAVHRDPESGEFGIEAGALMRADNGICCIDEFDKMDIRDQAAIHEAMEQQTITITKAGIQATLNARASVLAAANPIYGHYDTSKPLRFNVDISPPIMSRFDLFFIVLDECDEAIDYHVARHIVDMHQKGQRPVSVDFSVEQMQTYIRFARALKPQMTEEAGKLLASCYRDLRMRDASDDKAYRITVRQLESLIRLSESMARLHLDNHITPRYVREAARLLSKSIISVEHADVDLTLDDGDSKSVGDEDDGGDGGNDGDGMDQDDDDEDGKGGDDDDDDDDQQEKSISVTYKYYVTTANMIVYHVRKNEPVELTGMKQSAIEDLLMHDKQDLSPEEFAKELKTIRFVIHRLIEVDHILLKRKDAAEAKDRTLAVHPNYDPDSQFRALEEHDTTAQSSSPRAAPPEEDVRELLAE